MVWAVSLSTMNLSTHCLTPKVKFMAFRVWRNLVTLGGPRIPSVLYLHNSSFEASPKAISGRTSYLRVRLEFLRHPQLISNLFNGYEFGPPPDFTLASTCPWVDHPVSGLLHVTSRPKSHALLRLGFPLAPYLKYLTLLHTITRRTVLQKVRCRALTLFNCL